MITICLPEQGIKINYKPDFQRKLEFKPYEIGYVFDKYIQENRNRIRFNTITDDQIISDIESIIENYDIEYNFTINTVEMYSSYGDYLLRSQITLFFIYSRKDKYRYAYSL